MYTHEHDWWTCTWYFNAFLMELSSMVFKDFKWKPFIFLEEVILEIL